MCVTKQIAKGTFEKDYCLEKNLDWFEDRYLELELSLDRKRIKEFGKSLTARMYDITRWKALGAFEPKKAIPPSSPKKNQRPGNQRKNKTTPKVGKKNGKSFGGPPKGGRKLAERKGKAQKTQKTNSTKKKGTSNTNATKKKGTIVT